MQHWELLLFFFTIAFVYATVGFGGGSSYLAILTLYAMPFQEMKLTALICNIIVVTGGTLVFMREGQVNWRKVLPLALVSVPLAFLGAQMKLKQDIFFILLGFSLVMAAILMWLSTKKMNTMNTMEAEGRKGGAVTDGILGGAIGFLSGMVGIGGGIFLSPVLNLSRWDTPRKIAATASMFILVNSVAGIAGQLSVLPAGINFTRIGLLCAAVLAGGQLGSRMGAVKFDQLVVRRITAALVFVAGIEALWKHLPLGR